MLKQAPVKKYLLWLIISFGIIKIVAASVLELGNDESYYWLYTQRLQWNYFDHPPLVAIWGKLFSANLLLQDHVVFLRLGSIVAAAFATFFMYKTVAIIKGPRAGFFAACLYSGSFYTGITAGIFLMPDAPQMLFYTLALWMLAAITKEEKRWLYWILFGTAAGLCIMSKVHGIFLWSGLGLHIIFKKRAWLRNPKLYVAAGITALIASPILFWNISYDFITYRFHSARVVVAGHDSNWYNLFKAFVGQVVINNPVNVLAAFCAVWFFFRRKKMHNALQIFNFISFPFILLILFMAFFRQTFPHWSGPAFVALIPAAAAWLAEISSKGLFTTATKWSIAVYITVLAAVIIVVNFYPANMGSSTQQKLGEGDITLDSYGWKAAGKAFAAIYTREVNNGTVLKNIPVVCNTWWGAHDEYYFCRPLSLQMIGLGPVNEIHQYAWLNNNRSALSNMAAAYCIVHSDENYDARQVYQNYYSSVDTAATITVLRSSKPAHHFYVLRLSGWKNNELTMAK